MTFRRSCLFAIVLPVLSGCVGGATSTSTEDTHATAAALDANEQAAFDYFLGKGLTDPRGQSKETRNKHATVEVVCGVIASSRAL